ncbi:MAG: hypothetical protein KKF62_18775 [Bacteroidetes bacterium]|nr:hypothetical protein [Bacteroidota bacterium]MBU1797432.1 hypothetical protein [Bacteroidota bacterium]
MKTIIFFFLVFLVSGCSSVYLIEDDNSNSNIEILNMLGTRYNSTTQLKDSTIFSSDSIHIKSDSLYSNSFNTISIRELHSIELVDRIDGFADGIFIGIPIAIGATLTGFYLGLGWDAYIAGEFYYLASIIVGVIIGHNKVFLFNSE